MVSRNLVSQNTPPTNSSRSQATELRHRITPDWRLIAEQASRERDPRKLIRLVKALCDRLEELHAANRTNGKGDDSDES